MKEVNTDFILRNVQGIEEISDWDDGSDILIVDGIIKEIEQVDSVDGLEEIDCGKLRAYFPFTDVGTSLNEPGFEERETVEKLDGYATIGGYSDLITMPHTLPVTDSASMLSWQEGISEKYNINLLPVAALSKGNAGEELSEIMELDAAAAVAFSDGYLPPETSGIMHRGLEYLKAVNGILLSLPYDGSFAPFGQMHEGIQSASLGLPGIPVTAETLRLKRDIEILKYTESRLFVWQISSAESVEIIREAKEEGLEIYCSTPFLHLIETDEALKTYDTSLKVLPPLRSDADKEALITACLDGTIDVINSMHRPWNVEEKMREFPEAKFGALTLPIVYASLNTFCREIVESERFPDLFSLNARKIFNLKPYRIRKGEALNLVLIDREKQVDNTPSDLYDFKNKYPIKNKDIFGSTEYFINEGKLIKT